MPRFVPMNPMLQKMAPSLDPRGQDLLDVTTTGDVGPDLERVYQGQQPTVGMEPALPGINVPQPEPVDVRNTPQFRPGLDLQELFAEPESDTAQSVPQDFMNADNTQFARSTPQVDAMYGLSSFKRRPQTRFETPFA